jgi:hypothetical protein
MEVSALGPGQILALMTAGGLFTLAGLWLMFRSKLGGHATKLELLGIKFESSSAGLLVFLIGAAFLALPLFVPERRAISAAPQPREAPAAASSRPRPPDAEASTTAPPRPRPPDTVAVGRIPPSRTSSQIDARNWTTIGEDAFDNPKTDWHVGSFPSEAIPKFDTGIVGSEFRWEMVFDRPRAQQVTAPYPPARDFYLAVGVTFLEWPQQDLSAGLAFGAVGEAKYAFTVTKSGFYWVSQANSVEEVPSMLVTRSRVPGRAESDYSLAVTADNGRLLFSINGRFAGELRDDTFAGGQVGLIVESHVPGTAIVGFDDFTFRRKP